MKYIDNSFAETAAALMVMNPKCPVNFKSAASLVDYMKHHTEVELGSRPGTLSTFGFVITVFMSNALAPEICAIASVSAHLAAKIGASFAITKNALEEVAPRLGARGGPTPSEIAEALEITKTALKAMEV